VYKDMVGNLNLSLNLITNIKSIMEAGKEDI